MDFASIVLFLLLYYVRPQEWIGFVTAFKPVTLSIVLALAGLLGRSGGVRLRDIFQTPHDWLMLLFFVWMVVASPKPFNTLLIIYSMYVFYIVTVQALSRIERVQSFINWWIVMIFVIAALSVGSEYGFDFVNNTYDFTHGPQRGRLSLNTSIFDNPNALGHSVVPCLAMLYFTFFWRRPVFLKIATCWVALLPMYCIYLTASKGAFLTGFATLIAAVSFKRPKAVQFLILWLALSLGWVGMATLPRMGELDSSKSNEAIQGRVAAFKFGYAMMKSNIRGIGFGNFVETFNMYNGYPKAAHSSYVNIGCELGWLGLFLFIGIIYSCYRTLLLKVELPQHQERVRRILFILLVSYCVSSWMITWSYRAILFLMVGAIAAFHRIMLKEAAGGVSENSDTDQQPGQGFPPQQVAGNKELTAKNAPSTTRSELRSTVGALVSESNSAKIWNKVRWTDLILIFLLTELTVWYWHYIMNKM